jgi:hypothetical protein
MAEKQDSVSEELPEKIIEGKCKKAPTRSGLPEQRLALNLTIGAYVLENSLYDRALKNHVHGEATSKRFLVKQLLNRSLASQSRLLALELFLTS